MSGIIGPTLNRSAKGFLYTKNTRQLLVALVSRQEAVLIIMDNVLVHTLLVGHDVESRIAAASRLERQIGRLDPSKDAQTAKCC